MALVGDYDASTFVDGDFGTYPQLPVGASYYQPTMHWRVSVAGTVHGQAVIVGDLLFATQGEGRLFGDGLFGDQIFGGISDGNWTVGQVFFLAWDSTAPPADLVPYPNAGCPFTRADQLDGDWAPGWRIVVDAFYNDRLGSRTFGAGDFGDGVFGDEDDAGGTRWVDITQPGFRIEIGDGNQVGGQRVPVSEVVIELVDDEGVWFDMSQPSVWYQPQPGTALRVGLISPDFAYHSLIVAEIERIEDIHDAEHPRVVAVRGFGRVMDLTVDLPQVQRPLELASDRFEALVAAAGWWWDDAALVYPPGDAMLLADTAARDIVARDEIDRTIQAVGWVFDTDRKGRLRLRTWPHEPEGDPIHVVDCRAEGYRIEGDVDALLELWELGLEPLMIEDPVDSGQYILVDVEIVEDPPGSGLYDVVSFFVPGTPADAVLSGSITLANDERLLLNYVPLTNTNTPTPDQVVELNELSKVQHGLRGRSHDYPKMGLPWADPAFALLWARRIVNRFSWITRHVEIITADTALDQGWLELLADLDTGRALRFERNGIERLILDNVVVGWRHVLTPGNWASQLFTSTTTQTQ